MSQTLGSKAKVRWDRPKDRLNPARTEKEMLRIVEVLVAEITPAWVHAVEGGAYQVRQETDGRADGVPGHGPDPLGSAEPDAAATQGIGAAGRHRYRRGRPDGSRTPRRSCTTA